MRRAKLLILLAALAAVGVFTAATALAHSRPVRFDPAPGVVLETAPSSVTGWFSSDLRRAEESFIQVLDADGVNVATGDPQLSDDRRQMSTALQPGLGEGRYLVYWGTFDDGDGEAFSGCYTFFVGQAAADDAIASGQPLDGGADCPAPREESGGSTTTPPSASDASVALDVSVSGANAELTIVPTNFTPRTPDGSTVDPNFGHYHIYLDKVPLDVLTGAHSHDDEMSDEDMDDDHADDEATDDEEMADGGLVENPVMWVENYYTFMDLEPGVHTATVVLNYDNHTPLNPPVIASQTFSVAGAPGTGDDDDGGIPAWTLAIAVVGGLVAGGVGMKLVGPRA